jgi:hypothetical protein
MITQGAGKSANALLGDYENVYKVSVSQQALICHVLICHVFGFLSDGVDLAFKSSVYFLLTSVESACYPMRLILILP